MKTIVLKAALVAAAGVFIVGGVSGAAMAADAAKKGKPQTVCPVQGGAIDKSLYVDYKGYRIYFCCKGCPDEFKKNPEKYMKKLKESGVTPEKTPKGAEKGGDKKKMQHEHHHMD